jgi:hypothetical protein
MASSLHVRKSQYVGTLFKVYMWKNECTYMSLGTDIHEIL